MNQIRYKDEENYVDGKEAVTKPWSDKDFTQADQYKEGPTESKGAGKCNEEHS